MKRARLFLPTVILLGFVSIGIKTSAQAPPATTPRKPPIPAPQSPPVITHGPFLINPAVDGVVVVWTTDKPCLSWVEYGAGGDFRTFPQFGGLVKTARTSRFGLIEANTNRHVVRIDGLKPGTTIRYRVASKEILQFEPYEVLFGMTVIGEILEFKTLDPAKSEFGFRVFQDIHGDPAKMEALSSKAELAEADLVFFNGDTLSDLGRESYIFQGFIDPAARLFAGHLPFVYIRGNHDSRGALARRLEDFFPPRDGRFYYAFDHGPVHFIILDSGEDKPDNSPVYAGLTDFDRYREEQAAWLKSEIASPSFQKAVFRVVLTHFPPFGSGYGAEHLTKLWGPLLNEGRADLVLSGHYHRAYKYEPAEGKNTFPVLGGPNDGVIIARVTPAMIDLQVVDLKGNIIDHMSVKAKNRIFP